MDVARITDARVIRETDKALLVEVEGHEVWCPKSVIDDDSEVFSAKHGEGELVVASWWAEKEGL
jgi:hypothetical protein